MGSEMCIRDSPCPGPSPPSGSDGSAWTRGGTLQTGVRRTPYLFSAAIFSSTLHHLRAFKKLRVDSCPTIVHGPLANSGSGVHNCERLWLATQEATKRWQNIIQHLNAQTSNISLLVCATATLKVAFMPWRTRQALICDSVTASQHHPNPCQ